MTARPASGRRADSDDTSSEITPGANEVVGGGMEGGAALNSGGNRMPTAAAAAATTTASPALNDDSVGIQRDHLLGKQLVQLL